MTTPIASFFYFSTPVQESWYRRIWNRIVTFIQKLWKCVTNNIVIVVLLLVYVFFNRFWETQIGKHIIDNFLCHFTSSWLVNSIFIIAAVIFVVLSWINRGKDIKQSTKVLCLIAIGFWVYYRWYHPLCGLEKSSFYIDFKPLSCIKYVDIVLIYALSRLVSPYIGKRKNKVTFEAGFLKDAPLPCIAFDDSYFHESVFGNSDSFKERKKIASQAIHKIVQTDTAVSSFTFGINAQWGAGKTTFMNMMKSSLIKEKDYIIIDFNPWLYSKGNNLVSVFFEELSKTLKEYDLSIAKNIIDYSKMLSAFNTNETKVISSLIDIMDSEESLQETKQKIVKAIYKIKKKIVVFIDDLDRLDDNELLEMFMLIRNTSDFPYMYFIAAYDKTYIIDCLKSKIKKKTASYVEKIFQVEFHLPPYSNEEIRQYLYELINNYVILKDNDRIELKQFILEDEQGIGIFKSITNLREVIRLVNSFSSSYSQLRDDIYVIDLLLYEFFKTKFSSVFELFELKTDDILVIDQDFYQLYNRNSDNLIIENGYIDNGYSYNGCSYNGCSVKASTNQSKIDFVKYIETHLEDLHISELDARTIVDILSFLFSSIDTKRHRINNKQCFERYLRLSVFESEISEKEFKGLCQKIDIENIEETIRKWSYHRSYSLSKRIKEYKPSNRTEYMSLMYILFYYLSLESAYTIEIDSINSIIKMAQEFITDKQDAENVISSFLIRYGYNRQTARYLSFLYNYYDVYKEDSVLSKEELILIQKGLFISCEKALDSNNSMIKMISCFDTLLTYSVTNYTNESSKRLDLSDKYNVQLLSLMQRYVRTKEIDFINSIIVKTSSDKYTIVDCVQYIWGSWDGLYNYFYRLERFGFNVVELEIINEFKNFLAVFKNSGYESVEFPFEEIVPFKYATID